MIQTREEASTSQLYLRVRHVVPCLIVYATLATGSKSFADKTTKSSELHRDWHSPLLSLRPRATRPTSSITRLCITAASGTGGGFSTLNNMGGIFRYDMNTRTSTEIMSLSYRQLTGDEGLVGFAFSPDFNNPGTPGYQKLYVSSSQNGTTATERVEEYTVNGPNGTVPIDANNHPVVSNLVLQYNNIKTDPNHTIDWIGFDPTALGRIGGAKLFVHCRRGRGHRRHRSDPAGAKGQYRPGQSAASGRGRSAAWRCVSYRSK